MEDGIWLGNGQPGDLACLRREKQNDPGMRLRVLLTLVSGFGGQASEVVPEWTGRWLQTPVDDGRTYSPLGDGTPLSVGRESKVW